MSREDVGQLFNALYVLYVAFYLLYLKERMKVSHQWSMSLSLVAAMAVAQWYAGFQVVSLAMAVLFVWTLIGYVKEKRKGSQS